MGDEENGQKKLLEMSLEEIREAARRNIVPEAWEHIMGAAESMSTLRRNQVAMRRLLFRQRIFHDVTDPDTTLELFGRRLPSPIAVAPVGSFSKIGPRAEREVVEGAGRAGAMVFVSHAARSNAREWAEGGLQPIGFHGVPEPRERSRVGLRARGRKIGICSCGPNHGYGTAHKDWRSRPS